MNARLDSSHAQLTALNALLARATSLNDITTLQQQIASVQSDIDKEQGQRNLLDSAVDYSTASVSLSERGAAPVAAPAPLPLGDAVQAGLDNAALTAAASRWAPADPRCVQRVRRARC